MSHSYLDEFRILETLKDNEEQNMVLASFKDRPKDMVVINQLHRSKNLLKGNLGKLKKSLSNCVYAGKNKKDFVIVTKMKKGVPLELYLEEDYMSMERRLSIVFQYLKKIQTYDPLTLPMKAILVDESQLVVDDGKVSMYEWMIIKEVASIHVLEEIIKMVASVIEKILSYEIDDEEIPRDMQEFIEILKMYPKNYKSFKQIYEEYKGLYFYQGNGHTLSIKDNGLEHKKRIRKTVGTMIAIVCIGIIFFGGKECFKIIYEKIIEQPVLNEVSDQPTAYFDKIHMKNRWEFVNKSSVAGKDNEINESVWTVEKNGKETVYHVRDLSVYFDEAGTYEISLKVEDDRGVWSHEYAQTVEITDVLTQEEGLLAGGSNEECLQKLSIEYSDPQNIKKDTKVLKSGEYSLWFRKTKGVPKSIKINDLNLKQHSILSMWLRSDESYDVPIQILGYKNGRLMFSKSMDYQPSNENMWDLLHIDSQNAQVDQIKICVTNEQANVWLDDIIFDTYK